jgi:hypothetical protein
MSCHKSHNCFDYLHGLSEIQMLLHTAELRWFFNNHIPATFHSWFGTDRLGEPERRTDHYLILKGWETVGVKLRGGNEGRISSVDVKAIKGTPEIVQISSNASGYVDLWVKWSDSHESITPWIDSLIADGDNWVRIDKIRWLRMVSLDKGQPLEIPSHLSPITGCGIELTQLEVNKTSAWSLSFEAFGGVRTLRSTLLQCASWFFEQCPVPSPLSIVASYGYPTWLNTLYHAA